ncbi:hypothetical protein [Sulfitobacter sediminilitoris]|uniref:hypothetical protein n=1 Tax=Sulfitobacter sediminilitoris TaxID=2698830 RepID=UPI0013DBAE56|nr:hypothetical protein [Sulfitobacter sediminilitoris]
MGDPILSFAFNFGRSTIIALWYTLPYWIDRLVTARLAPIRAGCSISHFGLEADDVRIAELQDQPTR